MTHSNDDLIGIVYTGSNGPMTVIEADAEGNLVVEDVEGDLHSANADMVRVLLRKAEQE